MHVRRRPSVNEIQYVPGVCNIGPAEVSRRRMLGWAGLAVTVGLTFVVIWLHAPRLWRLPVFIPAFLCAAGFLQSHYRFCSGYAARGVYNFGRPGQTRGVPDAASQRADRRKGNWILVATTLLAAVVTLIVTAIA
jgi:predicted secreted protein